MDVSKLRDWKPSTLPKGRYLLEVKFANEFESSSANENGEYTTGIRFRLKVVGPENALKDNGESAIGYEFDDSLINSKPSSSVKAKEFLDGRIAHRLDACFGKDYPDNIAAEDWVGRQFWADCKKKFDEFKGEDVPDISKVYPLGRFSL